MDDPKGMGPKYKTYRINFAALVNVIEKGYKCLEDGEKVCFCGEFLKSGDCVFRVFEKKEDVKC